MSACDIRIVIVIIIIIIIVETETQSKDNRDDSWRCDPSLSVTSEPVQ
jgi:hypothetical protein